MFFFWNEKLSRVSPINIEDLKLIYNPSSGEALYVEWVEGPTKTRPGGLVIELELYQFNYTILIQSRKFITNPLILLQSDILYLISMYVMSDLFQVVLIALYSLKLSLLINCYLNNVHSIVTGINTNGSVNTTQTISTHKYSTLMHAPTKNCLGLVGCCSRHFYNSTLFDMVQPYSLYSPKDL